MATIDEKYVGSLPDIYREILVTFPSVEPARKAGWGLALQTIYSQLERKWSLGEITLACQQMERGGAVEIKNRIFVHPTPVGEQIIAALTGDETAPPVKVPDFPKPSA